MGPRGQALLATAFADDGIIRFRLTLAEWFVEIIIVFRSLVRRHWVVRGDHDGKRIYPEILGELKFYRGRIFIRAENAGIERQAPK